MAKILGAMPIWATRMGAFLEGLVFRLCGIDPHAGLDWQDEALARLAADAAGSGQEVSSGESDPQHTAGGQAAA